MPTFAQDRTCLYERRENTTLSAFLKIDEVDRRTTQCSSRQIISLRTLSSCELDRLPEPLYRAQPGRCPRIRLTAVHCLPHAVPNLTTVIHSSFPLSSPSLLLTSRAARAEAVFRPAAIDNNCCQCFEFHRLLSLRQTRPTIRRVQRSASQQTLRLLSIDRFFSTTTFLAPFHPAYRSPPRAIRLRASSAITLFHLQSTFLPII